MCNRRIPLCDIPMMGNSLHDTQPSPKKTPHFLKSLLCIPYFSSSKKGTRFSDRGEEEKTLKVVIPPPGGSLEIKSKDIEHTDHNPNATPARAGNYSWPLTPPPPYSHNQDDTTSISPSSSRHLEPSPDNDSPLPDINSSVEIWPSLTSHLQLRHYRQIPFPNSDFNTNAFVQICPHEKLTYERLHRLATLPNFNSNGAKIDALTPTSPQHHRGHDKATKQCQDSCKPLDLTHHPGYVAKLKGFGTYIYSHKPTPFRGPKLNLSFHWELACLPPKEVTYSTPLELQQLLLKTDIKLCPHKCISDMDIVNAIHPIINPDGVPADPIERYLAKEVGKGCAVCGTRVKVYERRSEMAGRTCRVDTVRVVGVGVGEEVSTMGCWEVGDREEEVEVEGE